MVFAVLGSLAEVRCLQYANARRTHVFRLLLGCLLLPGYTGVGLCQHSTSM